MVGLCTGPALGYMERSAPPSAASFTKTRQSCASRVNPSGPLRVPISVQLEADSSCSIVGRLVSGTISVENCTKGRRVNFIQFALFLFIGRSFSSLNEIVSYVLLFLKFSILLLNPPVQSNFVV